MRSFLFQVNDYSPELVNFMAPWIGLPVTDTSVLDKEAFGPRSIDQVVGSEVKVIVRLASGKTAVVSVSAAHGKDRVLKEVQAIENVEGDSIAELIFVDVADADKSPEALSELYFPKIAIPSLNPSDSRAQVEAVLRKCALIAADIQVRRQFAVKYGGSVQDLDMYEAQVDNVAYEAARRLGIDVSPKKQKSWWFW